MAHITKQIILLARKLELYLSDSSRIALIDGKSAIKKLDKEGNEVPLTSEEKKKAIKFSHEEIEIAKKYIYDIQSQPNNYYPKILELLGIDIKNQIDSSDDDISYLDSSDDNSSDDDSSDNDTAEDNTSSDDETQEQDLLFYNKIFHFIGLLTIFIEEDKFMDKIDDFLEELVKLCVKENSEDPVGDAKDFIEKCVNYDSQHPMHDLFIAFNMPEEEKTWHREEWVKLAKSDKRFLKFIVRAPEIEEYLISQHQNWKNIRYIPTDYNECLDILFEISYLEAKEIEKLENLPVGITKQDLKAFTKLCIESGIKQESYSLGFNLLLDRGEDKLKIIDNLPEISIDGKDIDKNIYGIDVSKYYMKKMPTRDYRNLLLGELTNCCQSIGNDAEKVAIDGMVNENSAFYAIFEKSEDESNLDKIVAQSYVWIGQDTENGGKTLVFDSWERRGKIHDKLMEPFYSEFAIRAEKEHGFARISIGVGGNTPNNIYCYYENYSTKFPGIAPYDDAEKQYVILDLDRNRHPNDYLIEIKRKLEKLKEGQEINNELKEQIISLRSIDLNSLFYFLRASVNRKIIKIVIKDIEQKEPLYINNILRHILNFYKNKKQKDKIINLVEMIYQKGWESFEREKFISILGEELNYHNNKKYIILEILCKYEPKEVIIALFIEKSFNSFSYSNSNFDRDKLEQYINVINLLYKNRLDFSLGCFIASEANRELITHINSKEIFDKFFESGSYYAIERLLLCRFFNFSSFDIKDYFNKFCEKKLKNCIIAFLLSETISNFTKQKLILTIPRDLLDDLPFKNKIIEIVKSKILQGSLGRWDKLWLIKLYHQYGLVQKIKKLVNKIDFFKDFEDYDKAKVFKILVKENLIDEAENLIDELRGRYNFHTLKYKFIIALYRANLDKKADLFLSNELFIKNLDKSNLNQFFEELAEVNRLDAIDNILAKKELFQDENQYNYAHILGLLLKNDINQLEGLLYNSKVVEELSFSKRYYIANKLIESENKNLIYKLFKLKPFKYFSFDLYCEKLANLKNYKELYEICDNKELVAQFPDRVLLEIILNLYKVEYITEEEVYSKIENLDDKEKYRKIFIIIKKIINNDFEEIKESLNDHDFIKSLSSLECDLLIKWIKATNQTDEQKNSILEIIQTVVDSDDSSIDVSSDGESDSISEEELPKTSSSEQEEEEGVQKGDSNIVVGSVSSDKILEINNLGQVEKAAINSNTISEEELPKTSSSEQEKVEETQKGDGNIVVASVSSDKILEVNNLGLVEKDAINSDTIFEEELPKTRVIEDLGYNSKQSEEIDNKEHKKIISRKKMLGGFGLAGSLLFMCGVAATFASLFVLGFITGSLAIGLCALAITAVAVMGIWGAIASGVTVYRASYDKDTSFSEAMLPHKLWQNKVKEQISHGSSCQKH